MTASHLGITPCSKPPLHAATPHTPSLHESSLHFLAARVLMRVPRLWLVPSLLLLAPLLISLASRTAAADPRGFAMGGTDAAVARGADAVRWNPAFLGLPGGPPFSLRLFQAGARAANNSFSMDQYNRLDGATWTDAQKAEILSSLGEGDLKVDALGEGGSGLSVGPVGLYADGFGAGDGQVARDAVDFALYGNQLDRVYNVSGSRARGVASARLLLGAGLPLRHGRDGSSALGLQVGIERGIHWEEATALDATFEASTDTASALGDFLSREGTRGNGFTVGLGYAASDARGGRYAIMVRDLYNHVNWTGTDRRYHLRGNHGAAESDNLDSLFATSQDAPVAASFSTRRAPTVDVSAERSSGSRTMSVVLEKGLGESPGVSKQLRASYGLEWRAISLLALRGGLSMGGGQGTWFSGGLGLHLGPLRLDAALGTRGIMPSHTRGLGAAVGGSLGI